MEDPVLHVYLPKQSAEELTKYIIGVEAALRVLDHRGNPASREGQEARASTKSRLDGAKAARDEIVRAIVRSARVVQGGGNEIYGEDLLAKLQAGGKSSLARLFPRFDKGDHRAWQAAFKRARDGSGQPFAVLGWDGKVAEHPVSKRVLDAVSNGARGAHRCGGRWKALPTDGRAMRLMPRSSRSTGTDTSKPNAMGVRWLPPSSTRQRFRRPGSVPRRFV